MARYIDADELIGGNIHFEDFCNNSFCNEAKASILIIIDEQPTADVQPVVHGEWVETSECLSSPKHYCSKCEIFARTHLVLSFVSSYQYRIEEYLDDFCPNCGVKMGKEIENNG